jgi:SAM-dependent methyltransferase
LVEPKNKLIFEVFDVIVPSWHQGLVADYWAEFNVGGPEIEFYRRYVERGQPALDAGCGAGRLLVPWLQAGLDVDGCDASADMVERCRDRARREGLDPTLFVQPLHELDPPRRYATVVACGVFGLGSTREQDAEALRRLRGALEPGGTLLLDMEVPYANPRRWPQWLREERAGLPEPWPESGEWKTAADGSEYHLRTRGIAIDPLDQRLDLEIRAEKWRDGELVAAEEHLLSMRLYFKEELALLLEREGFSHVTVRAGYEDRAPTPDDDMVVYEARN